LSFTGKRLAAKGFFGPFGVTGLSLKVIFESKLGALWFYQLQFDNLTKAFDDMHHLDHAGFVGEFSLNVAECDSLADSLICNATILVWHYFV
jgi:hypothetical protein